MFYARDCYGPVTIALKAPGPYHFEEQDFGKGVLSVAMNIGTLQPGHFLGDAVRTQSLAGATLCEAIYQPGETLGSHSHQSAFFCLLLEGGYDETYVGRNASFVPYSVAFHPPEEEHSVKIGKKPVRCFNVEVSPSALKTAESFDVRTEGVAEVSAGPLVWLTSALYREFRGHDRYSSLAVEGLMLEMLAALGRTKGNAVERKAPRWLATVYGLVRDSFRENLTVTGLARTADVHPVHLARVFRQFHLCSIGDLQRRLRIQYACSRMKDPETRLSDLALECGFADQTHFSRVFKRFTGMTPAAFRRTQ